MMSNGGTFQFGRPCITLKMGEATARFEAVFHLESAAALLRQSGMFSDVKISTRLGLLKTYGPYKVLLFRDGSISITPVQSKEDAGRLIDEFRTVLAGAALCELNDNKPVIGCKGLCPGGCTRKRLEMAGGMENVFTE